jgi:hypothetical protein
MAWTVSTRNAKADEIAPTAEPQRWGTSVDVVVVALFVLFAGVVACIIRPRNRRRSRRPVALGAATDSPDPPFIERRRAVIAPDGND